MGNTNTNALKSAKSIRQAVAGSRRTSSVDGQDETNRTKFTRLPPQEPFPSNLGAVPPSMPKPDAAPLTAPVVEFAQTRVVTGPPPPPPPPVSAALREAWFNSNYLEMAHLGRANNQLVCPKCRLVIPEEQGRNVKFAWCETCQLKWPLVVCRMISKQPNNQERWTRDSLDSVLVWSRMLTEEEEHRLFDILTQYSVLDQQELAKRLLEIDSVAEETSQEELALHLAILTTWHLREFNHVAFCRKFLPNGLLEWQPASEAALDTMEDLKGFKICAEEICEVRGTSLGKRLQWLREHVTLLRQSLDKSPGMVGEPLTIRVRRDCILEDASTCFMTVRPHELWRQCRYEFVDEPAFDAGGVAREFYSLIAAQVFDPQLGLFEPVHASDGLLSYRININSGIANELHLQYFRFLGRVMAKALVDGYTLPCHFTRDLYKHIIGEPIGLNDLFLVDPQLAKSMMDILEAGSAVDDWGLNFTTSKWEMGLTMNQVELMEGGENVEVTSQNVDKFLSLMLQYVMLDRHHLQLSFLLKGFEEVVPLTLMSVFTAKEFEGVLSGLEKVNVEDWMQHTEYRGKYAKHGADHEVIDWFWQYVKTLSEQDRGKLLQFATGSARVPAQGFQSLTGDDGRLLQFSIESTPITESVYPCAHTCFNRLDLPLYKTQHDLERFVGEVLEIGVTGFNLE
ncbi:hypothetical protein BASA81_000483 [Batrachochytrium salamandrivorans]|nr:hypothetical protein BASA81_000483 [Batrachochytrium salamandrivorans]